MNTNPDDQPRAAGGLWAQWQACFELSSDVRWHSLSRFVNTLIIMNISLFFLTELVIREGYYYTFYSLGLLTLSALWGMLPFINLTRLKHFTFALGLSVWAMYYLVYSIWYWVSTNRQVAPTM